MNDLALEIACCHLCAVSDIKEVGCAKEITDEKERKEEEKVDVTELMRKAVRICLSEGIDVNIYRDAIREARSLPLSKRNDIATKSKYFHDLVPDYIMMMLVMEA
jgi:hypothetical protein